MSKWLTEVEDGELTHVIPLDDLRDHHLTPDCWCKPIRDSEYEEIVIHSSMDKREFYEQRERKYWH